MNVLEVRGHQFGPTWSTLVHRLIECGSLVSPRGMPIHEITDLTFHVTDGRANILVSDIRKPSYRFMVAEWLWIWFGRNDVQSIALYNPNIAKYSDDGTTFAGAYGPMVRSQWPRVVRLLQDDRDTRQAVIQIYQPPTRMSKDVPCTLTLQFMIRGDYLNTTVNMRSSDVWLGLPYDFFNFSMIANATARMCGVEVGCVTFHIGSSHLYQTNLVKAQEVIAAPPTDTLSSPVLSELPPSWLNEVLELREKYTNTIGGQLPWSRYAGVLLADTNEQALDYLKAAYAITSK